MLNNAVLLDKGIKCLVDGLGMLESEQFIHVLLSQPFDYTKWREKNLCVGMSVEEISNAADEYCSSTRCAHR
jgi:hypothetical protein